MDNFDVPILFIVFKRLDTTKRVFEKIREIKPKHLFIVADGPRDDHPEEAVQCKAVRDYILHNIDWSCDLKTYFRDKNFGIRRGPPGGIGWFFSQVKQGIILEDDCLPSDSFFRFAREMLDRYANNESVMQISAQCCQPRAVGDASYYFSQIPRLWGWASWSRAWKKYDIDMKSYPGFIKRKGLEQIFDSDFCRTAWKCTLDQGYNSPFYNSWDTQWAYAFFENRGLAVTPNRNLVENLGSGPGASHSYAASDPLDAFHAEELIFPLTYPSEVVSNKEADEYDSRHFFHFSWKKYILCKLGLFFFTQKVYRKIRGL